MCDVDQTATRRNDEDCREVKRKLGREDWITGTLSSYFAVVDLGGMANPNPILWTMFHRSNHLFRKGLVVIPKIYLIHVLNSARPSSFYSS